MRHLQSLLPTFPLAHASNSPTPRSVALLLLPLALLASLCFPSGLLPTNQLSALAAAPTPSFSDDRQSAPLGTQLTSFSLTDYRGREWTLDDLSNHSAVVLTFLGTECPLAKLYTLRIQELERSFRNQKVLFLTIDANDQDSLQELAAHARKHELDIPFLKDVGQRVADQLGIRRTPEACILDSELKLCYRGRIDDQYGIGYTKKHPSEESLKLALQALLANQPIVNPFPTAIGCLLGRKRQASSDSEVTYANQISRIMQEHCVDCHRTGEIGPMALDSYDDVASWSSMILEVTQERRMPPWHADASVGHFANDRRLPDTDLKLLRRWVEAGTPAGDSQDLPPKKTYVAGWQLPREPDLVLNVCPTPFSVPATGEVKYQYFRVDPQLTEDRWIEAAEIQPGNRSVVHHILVFSREKGTQGDLEGHRGFLFGYVPGTRVDPLPQGMAKKLTKNSELIFQVHYTPVGTPQTDQSRLGLVFADPANITHEVQTTSAVQIDLNIPPRTENYTTSAMLPEELPQCQLLSMSPHMHLRGKSFRYTAILPDGNRKPLLDIPKYDFNWQTEYRLAQFETLPKGSRIFCEAAFDNSEKNLNNPDPSARVRWGDQTTDEMMIGYFHVAVERKPDGSTESVKTDTNRNALSPAMIFARLDKNGDQQLTSDEVPARLRTTIRRLDKNQDGVLELSELPDR